MGGGGGGGEEQEAFLLLWGEQLPARVVPAGHPGQVKATDHLRQLGADGLAAAGLTAAP